MWQLRPGSSEVAIRIIAMIFLPKSACDPVRTAPIVGGRQSNPTHRREAPCRPHAPPRPARLLCAHFATKNPSKPSPVAARSSPRVSITRHHPLRDAARHSPAPSARRRPATRARTPAGRAQDDRPGTVDDLPLDRRRLVPTAGSPGPACGGLALVGPGPLDPLARHCAALTSPRCAPSPGRAQPGASAPLTRRAAPARCRARAGCLRRPAPEPVRRRGHDRPSGLTRFSVRSRDRDARARVASGVAEPRAWVQSACAASACPSRSR